MNEIAGHFKYSFKGLNLLPYMRYSHLHAIPVASRQAQ